MREIFEFSLPTRVRFGSGTFKKLGRFVKEYGDSVLLVGYAGDTPLAGAYQAAAKSLGDAGLAVTEFLEVPPEPSAAVAEQGARRAVEAGANVVLGLGGGSPIDTAKAIAVLAKTGGRVWDYTKGSSAFRPVSEALPIIAVPTTAGTGSEVTNIAVFSHEGVGPQPESPVKSAIFGEAARPRFAVVDPDLAVGSPAALTAACGADALGHALEACLSAFANPIATALAERAVSLIMANLADAVGRPDDPRPRGAMALAALLAGAAFNSAGLTVTHAIAHALGGVLHVPHGLAVAAATPACLRFNAAASLDACEALARACGLVGGSQEESAARFVGAVDKLLRSVGLGGPVAATETISEDLLDRLVKNAIFAAPAPIASNPRPIDEAALKDLFGQILVAGG
ncbi:MAG: iron-containing alcohol dehydrogenase family protein [Pirellulales bacterium]